MIPIGTFADQDVAVFGLGRSGISACRALAAGGARVHAWDDNEAGRAAARQAGTEPFDLAAGDWSQFAALVLSPGVPLTHPRPHWTVERANNAGVEIIGDVELFARARATHCPDAPFVAITGTNGKSTTTALIAHVLTTTGRDAQMGGNIGVPILDLEVPAPDRVHVIELSSYQIELMPSLKPTVGVLLNVSPDHLDRHGDFTHYSEVKARLIKSAGFAVLGCDDETTISIARASGLAAARHALISGHEIDIGYGVRNGLIEYCTGDGSAPELIADLTGVASLRGSHNAQNAAAAAAVCTTLGLSSAEIARGLRSFPGLPHRLEQVGRLGNAIFVNDSKATNAESTANALAAFDRDIYWILGGLAKDGGIKSLTPYFERIAKAYLIGAAADEFAGALDGSCAYEMCNTLAVATHAAARDATQPQADQAVVLLSPACASFDQFRSFEARGDAFRDLVKGLAGIELGEGRA